MAAITRQSGKETVGYIMYDIFNQVKTHWAGNMMARTLADNMFSQLYNGMVNELSEEEAEEILRRIRLRLRQGGR